VLEDGSGWVSFALAAAARNGEKELRIVSRQLVILEES
jgi:hypothetical protein